MFQKLIKHIEIINTNTFEQHLKIKFSNKLNGLKLKRVEDWSLDTDSTLYSNWTFPNPT